MNKVILLFLASLFFSQQSLVAQKADPVFNSGKSNSGRKLEKHTRKRKKKNRVKPKRDNSITVVNNSILTDAKRHLGIRYRFGGEHPHSGFDCSGLVQFVFDLNGIYLPRTSREQAKKGKRIPIRKAQKGDLVFFANYGTRINHVGIISSEKGQPLEMIHSSSSRGVTFTAIESSKYWNSRIKLIKRIY